MELGLAGKVVLITGGSKGIGLACAGAFLKEGAKVVIASRSQQNLDRAAAVGTTLALAADLTRPEAAQELARTVESKVGPIDVLVNSAGAAKRYLPDDLDATAWHAACLLYTSPSPRDS